MCFSEYMSARADSDEWLLPLVGKVLVCSCSLPSCHATELASAVNSLTDELHARQTIENQKGDAEISDFFEGAMPGAPFGEEEWDAPVDVQSLTLWAANGTVSKTPSPVSAKPAWPSSWHWLLQNIRLAQTLIFWDLFCRMRRVDQAVQR